MRGGMKLPFSNPFKNRPPKQAREKAIQIASKKTKIAPRTFQPSPHDNQQMRIFTYNRNQQGARNAATKGRIQSKFGNKQRR